MGNTASLDFGAILHSIQSTPKHRKDAAANKARAGEVLIRVNVPELRAIQEQAEAFKDKRQDWPDGLEYIARRREVMCGHFKVECVASNPEEYKAHLLRFRNSRNFYWGQVQRKGEAKPRRVRRAVTGEPLHELVIMHAPWQMALLKTRSSAEVRTLLEREVAALMGEHQRLSGRDPVGATIHFDSGILHHNLHSCRVDENNQLVGHARLNTAGPWAVGASRQKALGCALSGQAEERLKRSLERHKGRMEKKGRGGEPFDIALTSRLDAVFEEWVAGKGLCEDYERCKSEYRTWHESKKEGRKWKKDIQRLPFIAAELCVAMLLEAFLPREVRQVISGTMQVAGIVNDLLDQNSKGKAFFELLRMTSGSAGAAKKLGREIIKSLPCLK